MIFLNKKKIRGVYTRLQKNGRLSYRASFTFKTRHISLGSFDTENEASSAYQKALEIAGNPSIGVDDYTSTSTLPFEKWVSIINFRDNGLYIRTPIYLKKRFFYYYLSPNDILKFDAEDLFYYSNHKILKRGGHLFLSDFGMQVSLTARYGIRSFAVAGRDYIFLNGDSLDFRYANIKIINKYFGVTTERTLPKPVYLSKININGSVIIGRYDSEEAAALAYNKVVTLLKEAGFPKKYEENYIEGFEHPSKKELYRNVSVSKRILKFISSLKDSGSSPKAQS